MSEESTSNEREQVERDTHEDPEPGVRQDARGERNPDLPSAEGTDPTSASRHGAAPSETTRQHRRHAEQLDPDERDDGGD